jgi:hypothetical protein
MYYRLYWLRVVIHVFFTRQLLRFLPQRLQTKIWARIHGVIQNKRMFPLVYREYVIYRIIKDHFVRSSGPSSILEFGCSNGTLTRRALHFVDVEGGADADVFYFAFDTFEGLPEGDDKTDFRFASVDNRIGGNWAAGSFAADFKTLDNSLKAAGHTNYRLVKGLFGDSLTGSVLEEISKRPPFLIVVDCDYYTSTKEIFEKIFPVIKSGTIFYFDDTHLNYYSTMTGELKAIQEVNDGVFGEGYELVEAHKLGMLGRRFYHFVSTRGETIKAAEGEDLKRRVLMAPEIDTPMADGGHIVRKSSKSA